MKDSDFFMKNIKEYARDYGVLLDAQMQDSFERYMSLLLSYNEKVNLTAITEPDEIIIKHFLDSIVVLTVADIPTGGRVIDVGTGAGFPGVPLKIARPDIELTLLDSLNKRVVFLQELSVALSQDNRIIHGRAEDCPANSPLREQFDIATSRAVASLPALCEYCMPYVKVGGSFVALKGYETDIELQSAESAIKLMGGRLREVKRFELPMDNKRSIIIIEKISQTPAKYPRKAVKITKTPL